MPKTSIVSSSKAFINIKTCGAVIAPSLAFNVIPQKSADAFDGSGSNAYSGKGETSKSDLKKWYQHCDIADVRDIKKFGAAVGNGETDEDD